MLFWTIIKVAVKSLFANKLRSFLAMLGIIIGTGAVIAMLALGEGAQRQVLERISLMGTNLLVVRPGKRGTHGVVSGEQQNLTVEDALAITNEVPSVKQVAPVVRGSAQFKYFNKNTRSNVIGTSITYFSSRNFQIGLGRSFTEAEVDKMARVALLGTVTAENLFGVDDPLGETVKINGINFKIVGVLKEKGDRGWYNPDDQAIIPYTTAMKQLFGAKNLREISVQVADGADMDGVIADISRLIRRRHRIQPGSPDDFYIRNYAEIQDTYSNVSKTFTMLLGGIASISLLVGGIGIMNIMLVTVTERTREIGVRKAIGAKDRDILRQFLIEAVLMSALGGLIGVAVGVGAAKLMDRLGQFTPVIELSSVLLALSFTAAVGIFFGYYPAHRAAMLDPIEALRYE